MIKGCQKKIIHLKNTNSPYFEEAYFIMKDTADSGSKTVDIVREAERIARNVSDSKNAKKEERSLLKYMVPLLLGAISASLLFGVVLIIAALVA